VHDLKWYLVIEFIEEYEDGALDRPSLERRVAGILGPDEASRLLEDLRIPPARADARPPAHAPSQGRAGRPPADVAGLDASDIRIPLPDATLLAYLVCHRDARQRPAIVAIHENKGLVEHIKDCARRLASAGYVVLAPDLLSRQGGTANFTDPNDATAALGRSDPEQNTRDLVAALDWLAGQPGVDRSRLGVTGWCMGGGYTWRMATQAGSRIRAAVPWYGPNPPDGVENIAAPVFAIYGELDQRINAGIGVITRGMQTHGKPFVSKVYPGAQHAFNNDTNPERYHPEQARIAWGDMLEFFARHLEG
jgi:carboxymethylenebutenolidase